MIKSAVFTIGILAVLAGFGFATITVMGAAMSDNPSAGVDANSSFIGFGLLGLVGIAMIVGAFFIP